MIDAAAVTVQCDDRNNPPIVRDSDHVQVDVIINGIFSRLCFNATGALLTINGVPVQLGMGSPRELLDSDTLGRLRPAALEASVLPAWTELISYQQQTVLLLALRGPDGVRKHHPSKQVHRAYRGSMIRAAARGRFLHWGENADSFMGLEVIASEGGWDDAIDTFFAHVDELPHHYVSHLAHAAQIIAVHCPLEAMARRWGRFYARWVDDAHLEPESAETLNKRLGDWGRSENRLATLRALRGLD